MTDINQLFFELIQVAIGTRICLSHTPSADEWGELYAMAKKQSLVGVCFAGVQRLQQQRQEPPEMLYLTWMGMAAKIQQRNEVVNRQCVDLQKRLSADGLKSSILKGQGVAALYMLHDDDNHNHDLSGLRQSGDIDVYVACGMEKVLEYCTEKFGKVEWDYINAHAPFYPETEVEMHWRAQAMTNLFANKKLQEWFKSEKVQSAIIGGRATLANGEELVVPTAEFNAFYILLHCYHHMFESGLGLRQLMDFYFVLKELDKKACGEKAVLTKTEKTASAKNKKNIVELYEQFGMKRFATGIMWIMKEVFGLKDEYLLCEPDEKEGRFLLNEVMQNGNFGHHDDRKIKVKSKLAQPFVTRIQHNWHLATHYPAEFCWAPMWLVYHYIWKRTRKK